MLPEVKTRFTDVRSALADLPPGSLENAGLSGPLLSLKLDRFNRARELLRPGFARGAFKRLLRWANVLLDSLSTILPPAKAIEEFKKTVDGALADAEEDAQPHQPENRAGS